MASLYIVWGAVDDRYVNGGAADNVGNHVGFKERSAWGGIIDGNMARLSERVIW